MAIAEHQELKGSTSGRERQKTLPPEELAKAVSDTLVVFNGYDKDALSSLSQYEFHFIHGWNEPKELGYQGGIKPALEQSGAENVGLHELSGQADRGPSYPQYEQDLNMLRRILDASQKPVILTGHSLGGRLLVNALRDENGLSTEQRDKIAGIVLVSPAILDPKWIPNKWSDKLPAVANPLVDLMFHQRRVRRDGHAESYYEGKNPDYDRLAAGVGDIPLVILQASQEGEDTAVPRFTVERFGKALGASEVKLTEIATMQGSRGIVWVDGGVGHIKDPKETPLVGEAVLGMARRLQTQAQGKAA